MPGLPRHLVSLNTVTYRSSKPRDSALKRGMTKYAAISLGKFNDYTPRAAVLWTEQKHPPRPKIADAAVVLRRDDFLVFVCLRKSDFFSFPSSGGK